MFVRPITTHVPLSDVRDSLDLVGLDEGAFVERMIGDLPEKPDNYEASIDINR